MNKNALRILVSVTFFVAVFGFIISGRGFGGLYGLIISPLVLIGGLLLNELIRKIMKAKEGLHLADFLGVGLVLMICYFTIPEIR